MRWLGIVRSYDDLHRLLRQRAEEIGAPRLVLDEVSGLQSGYTAKLLSDPPIRKIGLVSLGPLLGTLGVKLVAIEDEEAMARVQPRLTKRKAGPTAR